MKSKKSKKRVPKSESKKLTDKEALSEVDKTFYELQIADLNRKLNRFTNLSLELEQRNAVLTISNQKLDEDRADVIAFLKKTVQEQTDEINDVVGRLEGITATRIAENESFNKVLATKDEEFQKMQNELQSEIKLLEGKLNALEEFRLQRDELNRKYEQQAIDIKAQEQKHNEALYNVERKFIVDKNTIVKQMEARLSKLSGDFNSLTDQRILETTQRLIRENIALNRENGELIEEQKTLCRTNVELRQHYQHLYIREEVATGQADMSLKRFHVLQNVVLELTQCIENMKKDEDENDTLKENLHDIEQEIIKEKQISSKANDEIRILQSKLQDCHDQRKILLSELSKTNDKCSFITCTLFEAIFNIRHVARMRKGLDEEEIKGQRFVEDNDILPHKESILNELYNMFMAAREAQRECIDLQQSLQFYDNGCLGLLPKLRRDDDFRERSIGIQVDMSFEEFLLMDFSDLLNRPVLKKQNPIEYV